MIKTILGNILYFRSGSNLSYILAVGFVLLFCFVIQTLSGVFLLIGVNNFKFLVKLLHNFLSSFLVLLCYIHFYKNLYIKCNHNLYGNFAYFSGWVIFIVLFLACFTGYLIPWGQMSFWGTKVITNFFDYIPVIGGRLKLFVICGFDLSSNITLPRFKALHVMLGLIIWVFILFHLVIVHNKRTSNIPFIFLQSNYNNFYLYPYIYNKDFFIFLILFFIVMVAYCLDPLLFEDFGNNSIADYSKTPLDIKPDWYFLPNFAALKYTSNKYLASFLCLFLSLIVSISFLKFQLRVN